MGTKGKGNQSADISRATKRKMAMVRNNIMTMMQMMISWDRYRAGAISRHDLELEGESAN